MATLVDSYSDSNCNSESTIGGSLTAIGQTFTGIDGTLSSAIFYVDVIEATPSGNCYAKIYAHTGTYGTSGLPTGTALAVSDALDVANILSNSTFTFTGANKITLVAGTKYVVTFEWAGNGNTARILVNDDSSTPTHSGNETAKVSGAWEYSNTYDTTFEVYVDTVTSTTIQKTADYDVASVTTIQKTALYTVISAVDITKTAQYTVPSTTTITKTAQYYINVVHADITKSAQYVAIFSLTIQKTAKYEVSPKASLSSDSTVTSVLGQEISISVQNLDGDSSINALGVLILSRRASIEADSSLTVDAGDVSYTRIQKTYLYKIYTNAGVYVTTWNDVVSDFGIKEELNTSGSEIVISLAREADDFGEGVDVNYRNKVEIYIIDSETPNGTLRFTGFISKYNARYNESIIDVTVLGYGAEMASYVMEDGAGSTTVAHLTVDPGNMIKAILDDFNTRGGVITYDGTSIDLTSTSVSYTFNTNTVKEGIDKALELAPEGWYYYVDQATNLFHFHAIGTTPNHTFAIGRDITALNIEKDMESVVNTVYFSGGGGPPILYKKYTNATSVTNYGEKAARYKDGRVTLETTADLLASQTMQGSPEILVAVAIVDSNLNDLGYDLETIKLGQMVKIGSSGLGANSEYDVGVYDTAVFDYDLSDLSSITFQLTSLDFTGDIIAFSLSTTPPDITKRIEDIKRNVIDIQSADNPGTYAV